MSQCVMLSFCLHFPPPHPDIDTCELLHRTTANKKNCANKSRVKVAIGTKWHHRICVFDASHLTRRPVGPVDEHLALRELLSILTAPAARHRVTEVRLVLVGIDLWHAVGSHLWEVRYWHCCKSFVTLDTNKNQSADKSSDRVILRKHDRTDTTISG